MKYLVIGASGFIGKNILSYLKSKGYNSLGTRLKHGDANLLKFNLLKDRIQNCIPKSFIESDEKTVAIICAAICQIDRCYNERKISYVANVTNTIKLIKDLNSLGIKSLFISTSFVFDGKDGYYNEKSTPAPISEYGRQKLKVEEFILNNSPETVIIRLDKIVGSNPSTHHLFSEWYNLITNNQPIICIKDQVISPTYVIDVAKAIELIYKNNLSGLYHVANSEFISREELAKQFVSACKADAKVIAKTQKKFNFLDDRPLKSYLDSTKFREKTGMVFTPMRDVFNEFLNKLGNK